MSREAAPLTLRGEKSGLTGISGVLLAALIRGAAVHGGEALGALSGGRPATEEVRSEAGDVRAVDHGISVHVQHRHVPGTGRTLIPGSSAEHRQAVTRDWKARGLVHQRSAGLDQGESLHYCP